MTSRAKYKIAFGLMVSIIVGAYVILAIFTDPSAVLIGVSMALVIAAAVFKFVEWLCTEDEQL